MLVEIGDNGSDLQGNRQEKWIVYEDGLLEAIEVFWWWDCGRFVIAFEGIWWIIVFGERGRVGIYMVVMDDSDYSFRAIFL